MAELIASRTIVLIPGITENFISPNITIDAQTATLTIRLRRPTTLSPLAWDNSGSVEVKLILTLDGERYEYTG